MRKTLYAAVVAAIAAAFPLLAEDFSNVNGAPKWKVYNFNRSGQAFSSHIPYFASGGGIAFDFLYTPDTALLTTDHPSYRGSLLGDISGETVSATIQVNVTAGTKFTYYGEGTPQNSCGTPANVRFYFQGNTNGKFEFTKYWWSNPTSMPLAAMAPGVPVTISVKVSPEFWSDWNGQFGTTVPSDFQAAAKDVSTIGLSFGGGCFFENGVGIMSGSGSGSFQLQSFSVAQ